MLPLLFIVLSSSVVRELFSSNSTNSLYDKAVADCLAHEKLADLLGEPIKAFGESRIQLLTGHHVLCSQGRKIGDTEEITLLKSIMSIHRVEKVFVFSSIFKG